MTTDDAATLLAERGALMKGHFQLSSGRHADTYIEKFRILQWPDLAGTLCGRIATAFGDANIGAVAGPTTGGIILSYETARALGRRSLIAEKREGGPGREFKRGFELAPGERVLVVDDVLTTGGSIREVLAAVEAAGAVVAGVGVLVDRTGGTIDFGVPFHACLSLTVASWAPDECALCRNGVPLTLT